MPIYKDGGPAFPLIDGSVPEPRDGLTKRDYFAAAAMTTLLHSASWETEDGVAITAMAETAYYCADAMLKARQRGPTS